MENLFRVMEMVSLVMEMAPIPFQSPFRFNPPVPAPLNASHNLTGALYWASLKPLESIAPDC
jgi:hypothetical protein